MAVSKTWLDHDDAVKMLSGHRWLVGNDDIPGDELVRIDQSQALTYEALEPFIKLISTGTGSGELEIRVDETNGRVLFIVPGSNVPLKLGDTANNNLLQVGTQADDRVDIIGSLMVTETGLRAQVPEPANPPEGQSVEWLSNGTGFGDVGDVCIKSTESAVTMGNIIHDFSAGTVL